MIRLGYEIGTGKPVDIPGDRHIGVTGQTQMSGKTTTLEALVHRSGRRAVAFVTKRAENSFREAHSIPPYFSDSADWEFVASILEAMLGEKLKFERSWIMNACAKAEKLVHVLGNVRTSLYGVKRIITAKSRNKTREWEVKPASGLNASILTCLEAYLAKVVPQIESLPYTKELKLAAGLNVMDLSEYTTEMQSLVIRSVLEWVYERERNTIVIIPESWEFIPQNRRSPVLLAAEELIRKGAASGNYVWLDSQDIAGVHKNVLRSVGVWILGVQREGNEIKRTIGHAGAPATKLKPEAIMQLTRGQFYVCYDSVAVKTYVQPFWVGDVHAQAIARGEEKLESAERIWRENRAGASRGPGQGRTGDKLSIAVPHQQLQIQDQVPNEEETEAEIERPAAAPEPGPDDPGLRAADSGEGIEEETMWKEKYEALMEALREAFETGKFEKLEGFIDLPIPSRYFPKTSSNLPDVNAASPQPPFPKRVDAVRVEAFTDAGYEMLMARIFSDPKAIAALDAARPTLRITTTRPVLAMDCSTIKGRIALLIHEKFFAQPRPAHPDVLREFKRRGWLDPKSKGGSIITNPMAQITELGFLALEDGGYQAVPGMNIEKAEA